MPGPGCGPRRSSPWRGASPGACVLSEVLPRGAKVSRRQARVPHGGRGAGSGGPGRAGCQGWEDVEVGTEVSVRAQAQGGKNSCWSCIIKILLSGAWQSPINPHQGSTLNTLSAAAAPCSPGTRSGLALPGESRGPGYGRPGAAPGWAGMGTGEGESAVRAPGQACLLAPPSRPALPLSWEGSVSSPLPLSPSAWGYCTPFLPFSPRLPALLWVAPQRPERFSSGSHPPQLMVVIPWCPPASPKPLPCLRQLLFLSSPAQVPNPSSTPGTLDPNSIYPSPCAPAL